MILGYMLAVVMGLTLGLIGAGGSILTVPIFVYLLGVKPVIATGYSLLIVGSAALMGAARYWKNSIVNLRAAAMFAVHCTGHDHRACHTHLYCTEHS